MTIQKDWMTSQQIPTPSSSITVDQFDAWVSEDSRAEFSDGEVFLMPPVSNEHSDMQSWFVTVMRIFARRNNLGIIRGPEFQMRLGPKRFEPDVLFVAAQRSSAIHKTYLDGPADLVVEIVSPESAARDWHDKLQYYEAGGVPEYWIIDPAARRCDLYHLQDAKYQMVTPSDGRISSRALTGFSLFPKWLWQSPLPDELEVLRELGVEQNPGKQQ